MGRGLEVASFVLSLASVILFFLPFFGLFLAFLGLFFSITQLRIRKTRWVMVALVMGLFGFILGIIELLIIR